MRKLMMVIVIGLALATTGFSQGRGGSRSGGGHSAGGGGGHSFSSSGRSYGGGGYGGRGYGGNGGRYGGSSAFGFGFAYAPDYYAYPYPGTCYDPSYDVYVDCRPAYYPGPVVGGFVFAGRSGRGRAFVGRGSWRRFGGR